MNEEQFEKEGFSVKDTETKAVLDAGERTLIDTSGETAEESVEHEPAVEDDKELAALLETAERMLTTLPPRDPKEIDAKAAEYEALSARLEKLPEINESRLARLEKIERAWREEIKQKSELTALEYEDLEKSESGKKMLSQYLTIQEVIQKMEAANRDDEGFVRVLEQARVKRDELYEKINERVFASAKDAFERRLAGAREKTHKHYARRAEELEKALDELKKDPEVMQRHGERIRERKEKARQEHVEGLIARLNETAPVVQSLFDRQRHSLGRIEELAGTLSGNPATIRSKLIDGVMLGEGKQQIRNAAEVVPWKSRSYLRYLPAVQELRAEYDFEKPATGTDLEELAAMADETGALKKVKQRAYNTLRQIETVLKNDTLLFRILGKEWETVRGKEGKQVSRQTEFYAAFERRAKNDKEGKTAQLQRARAEAKEKQAETAAEIQTLVAKGGFEVRVPGQALREVDPQRRHHPDSQGAVLIEAKKSKKGNVFLEIAGTAGAVTRAGILGKSFANLDQLPHWLKEGLKQSLTAEQALDEKMRTVRTSRVS